MMTKRMAETIAIQSAPPCRKIHPNGESCPGVGMVRIVMTAGGMTVVKQFVGSEEILKLLLAVTSAAEASGALDDLAEDPAFMSPVAPSGAPS